MTFQSDTHYYAVRVASDARGIAILVSSRSRENQKRAYMVEAYFVDRPKGGLTTNGFATTEASIAGRDSDGVLLSAASRWADNQARSVRIGHESLNASAKDALNEGAYREALLVLELEFPGFLSEFKRWRSDTAGHVLIDEVLDGVRHLKRIELRRD